MMPEDAKSTNSTKEENTNSAEKNTSGEQQDNSSATKPTTTSDGPSIFNVKKPKDIRDGLANGVGNIAKGVLGGAALIVSAPVVGAYGGYSEGGAYGCAKGLMGGLAMGVLGGVSMTVGGAVTGVYQIGRGMINTPYSISSSTQGKYWDEEKREWIFYNLDEEAKYYLHITEEEYLKSLQDGTTIKPSEGSNNQETPEARPMKTVSDTEYYDLLGVPPNATSSEIRKAYYLKAKQNHPDRHPNDPEAHAKFQAIGQAYQVLSDDNLRANYDSAGKDGIDESMPKMDSSTLYAMIFGSEKFIPYIGELKLTSQMQQSLNPQHNNSNDPFFDKLLQFKQKKRELECATKLVQKLQIFVDNEAEELVAKEQFLAALAGETEELSSSPFGQTLLTTIGRCYREHAVSELNTLEGLGVGLTQASRSVRRGLSIASEGIRAAYTASEVNKLQRSVQQRQQLQQQQQSGTSTDAAAPTDSTATGAPVDGQESEATRPSEANGNKSTTSNTSTGSEGSGNKKFTPEEQLQLTQKIEKLSGHMFAVMWYVTEMDIKSTLATVCSKITYDRSVDDKVRIKRLRALKYLGEYFISHGGNITDGITHLKAKLHDQMEAAAKHAMDGDEDDQEEAAEKKNSSSAKDSKASAAEKTTPATAESKGADPAGGAEGKEGSKGEKKDGEEFAASKDID